MTERTRGRRGGGGAARRAARTAPKFDVIPTLERKIATHELLDEETLVLIETNAETVLEEIGVVFSENQPALARWREAGADVRGDRVHIPRGLARKLCATAPAQFTHHARNPARSVEIGANNMVFAPVYGPPFVRDLDGKRRYATIEDFRNFVRLGYMSKYLHLSGGTLCEPTDVPVNKRHLDMLHAHITLSDKPYMGAVTDAAWAQDCVEMSKIIFGPEFVAENAVMTSLVNINSPLTFDHVMMNTLEVYASNMQACIVSPFIVGGAMAPVSVIGTLTQVLAEVMAGVAYSQLVRAGAPVIFGAFVTSIDMNSGAPTFGTPEAAQITQGAGQLARRLGLPYRSAGGFTGSKIMDAQAGYESANSLQAGLQAGVNFMLHAAGWLEGGLVSGFEKFVADADQLGVIARLAGGVDTSEEAQAMDAIREVGPGGHFLGCAHTQAHFQNAFWRSDLLDYKPFETWDEEGARDTATLARERVTKLLSSYVAPEMDPEKRGALEEFIARRKSEMSDSYT